MKKLFLALILCFSISTTFAETYPASIWLLLSSYKNSDYVVHIVATNSNKYVGKILVVQNDYIVIKLTNEDVVVLSIGSLSEVSHE